ncbi:MAG TPA: efflux RND transporter periplasmic adaptor subunit [Deltaproteobacteria bacterium]|nr:efflux RND transporter periplasmic adaptor subunit [Deltaproteobacteria bacterium]HPR54674.1 efflux RND transporter periplasmic adaptor subunit [Deltaproteobacteria bacterium]HXK46661.1 efflux RND transporter periplasmic adaptor subunit [Deltaproteobacteria bacterium]
MVEHLNGLKVCSRRFRRVGIVLSSIIVMAVPVFMETGCTRGADRADIKRPTVTGVTVTAVSPVQSDKVYEASGTVRSDRTSIIASRVMGSVTSLNVKEGDTVTTGRLLLTLDDTDARQRLRAATMAVEAAGQNKDLAEATWKRYQGLFDQQVISRQEMDRVETDRKVAAAEFERAGAMAQEAATYLSFTRIVASAPGVVTAKHTDVGSMASPGTPLLTIEGIGDAYVEVHADEGLSGRILPGMGVEVIVDALGKDFHGTVREVLPDIDPRTRTFTVKIDIPDRNLRTGLFTRARLPVGRKEALVVPAGAIIRKGQLTGVYVVDGSGVISYRLIKEGPESGEGIEVLSGLSAGERIVTGGVERAVDGGAIAENPR